VLAGQAPSTALPILHELVSDPHPVERRAAVDSQLAQRQKASKPVLIERLASESRRMRDHVRQAQGALTGLDHGDRPLRWRAWWESEGEDFELPAAEVARALQSERQTAREENPTRAVFYGIPLASDRLTFVLDISGSMSALVADGKQMRIDVLRSEVVKALEGMAPETRFNLIFFSSNTDAWSERLVKLDARTLAEAKGFVGRQGAGGGTALYDAVLEALEDEEIDTLVILSDGEPTEGKLVDPLEIVEDLRARNRLRGVVFHTVAVGGGSGLLRELSAMSGGIHHVAR
jgi:hypothetical protein